MRPCMEKQTDTQERIDFCSDVQEYLKSKGFGKLNRNTMNNIEYIHSSLPLRIEINQSKSKTSHWDYHISFIKIAFFDGDTASTQPIAGPYTDIAKVMVDVRQQLFKAAMLAEEVTLYISKYGKED